VIKIFTDPELEKYIKIQKILRNLEPHYKSNDTIDGIPSGLFTKLRFTDVSEDYRPDVIFKADV
jgi:hypothetical protein